MMRQEQNIPYVSIVAVFMDPEIKPQLHDGIRYERFQSEGESKEYFSQLLGPDVRFVSHPSVTYNITREFIQGQNHDLTSDMLSGQEKTDLLTAALVHDWGELKIGGVGHGDVTFEEHTGLHEDTEVSVFDLVLESVTDIKDKDYILKIYQEVVQNRESKLGQVFNAIERIGYLETGIRAFIGYKRRKIINWSGLTGNVLSNQIIKLLEYSQRYPYVYQVLSDNRNVISKAFNQISHLPVLPDNRGIISFDEEKFNKNFDAWQKSQFFR